MSKKGERKEAWFRIVVLIVSGIILYFWGGLAYLLAIINWFIVIFTGKKNKDLSGFLEYWNTENYKFMRYLTFVSNKRPFPFSRIERMSKVEK